MSDNVTLDCVGIDMKCNRGKVAFSVKQIETNETNKWKGLIMIRPSLKETAEYWLKELSECGRVVPSGSYFICGKEDTDIDFFVDDTMAFRRFLSGNEFTSVYGGKEYIFTKFFSYRKDNINVILVHPLVGDELDDIELATELCKSLNLINKEDRLRVFNSILIGYCSPKKTNEALAEKHRKMAERDNEEISKAIGDDDIPF